MNAQSYSTVNYQNNDEVFINPERGFYHAVSSINLDNLISFRLNENISLIYRGYHLDDFKESDIPLWFLEQLNNDFNIIRQAGMKLVLRFQYTEKSTSPYGDAEPEIVKRHIEQLKPYLQENSDVIFILQAGLIGAWGEWYYTDYFSSSPGHITEEQWNLRRELIMSLLDAMPANRMVQIRTPDYKKRILQQDVLTPVSQQQAFTNTPIARIAHHNDCFVADYSDMGTYGDTLLEKPYLEEDSKYTLVGGETCKVCSCADCENSLKELRRFHWTFLNIDYHTAVLQGWIDEGCFPTVQKKLGYRYRMVSANIQNKSKQGGVFNFQLKIVNDGWANPGNPRNVELVLRSNESGKEYFLPIQQDPRKWPLKDTIFINVSAGIPDLTSGNYSIFLNLPDPELKLTDRVEYSIRTANTGTWEAETAYNSLEKNIEINVSNITPNYNGGVFFKPKKDILMNNVSISVDGNPDDWSNITVSYLNNSQNCKSLKYFNTYDSVYFMVQGSDINPNSQLFIDVDCNVETGYEAWQWTNNGADYLIENNVFYKYSGNDHEWAWTEVANIDFASNDSIVEFGLAISQFNNVPLEKSFSMAYLNDPEGIVQSNYIPSQNTDFLKIEMNKIFGSPLAISGRGYSNNNVIYWSDTLSDPSVFTLLERSEDGQNFETVYLGKSEKISFTDTNLEENTEYQYQIQYRDANTYSEVQGPFSLTTSTNQKMFVNVAIDGESSDWNIVAPLATSFSNGNMYAMRFVDFNDALFFSISGFSLQNYVINLDVNNDLIFDFKIVNDSLFAISNNQLDFIKKISSVTNEGFLEAKVDLADIDWLDQDILNISASVNNILIPDNNDSFKYLKTPLINSPEYFYTNPSSGDYYTRLLIKWSKTENTEGYIIERSVDDTLNFEVLADKSKNSIYHIDTNLDSSMVYYYRLFSYNGIYRSAYTPISDGKPGTGLSVAYIDKPSNTKITFAPNPFHENTKLQISVVNPEKLTIEIYDNMFRKIKQIFKGEIYDSKTLILNRENLNSGLYFVRVSGQSTNIMNKIIIE
jgi:hypothetical protein